MFISKTKKSPYYQLTYLVDSKRTTISTKAVTKKEAQVFLQNFRSTKAPNDGVIIQHDERSVTIESFKKEYLDYCKNTKSKSYVTTIEYAFRQLSNFVGNTPLNEIGTKVIDQFVTNTFARTMRGAHQYYRTLKAAFNKAAEWEFISVNPFMKIKFPKLSKSFPAFVLEDELLIILSNTPYQYLKDIFTVGFYSGLRLGELINMRWDWVDLFQNQITVKCSETFLTKSKKERIVPMCEKVKTLLTHLFNNSKPQSNEVVFYRIKGRKLHKETVSKQFKQILRKSNLNEKIHFHSLRHSFASLLVQRGVSLYVIKELLGHEDLKTTQIYSHLQQQNLKEAINVL